MTYFSALYYYCFKRVFVQDNNKEIFASFLNELFVHSGRQLSIQDVECIKPVLSEEISKQKQGDFVMLCKTSSEDYVIVEVRIKLRSDYVTRDFLKFARAYAEVPCGFQNRGTVNRIIFIALCDYVVPEYRNSFFTEHSFTDQVKSEKFDELSFFTILLPNFKKNKVADLENNFEKWMLFLKSSPEVSNEELKKLKRESAIFKRALDAVKISKFKEHDLLEFEAYMKIFHDCEAEETFSHESLALRLISAGVDLEILAESMKLSISRLKEIKDRQSV